MRVLAALSIVALLAAAFLGGTAPFARVLMAAGLPGLAARITDDPQWRAIAIYRAGRFEDAATDFTHARAHFNLGNAQTHAGNYAAALEAFDMAIARGHPDARANFDVVAAFYAGMGLDPDALALFPRRKTGPTMEAPVGEGEGRAAGTGSETTNTNTMMGLAELDSRGRLGVRRVFDDKFMIADDRWLQQLADVPGDYLAARILAEHKRRAALGLSPPPAEDPR
jgi:Ca-activated chloride channel family protein